MSYDALAERMELRRDEVQQAFVDALIALNEAVERQEQAWSVGEALHRIASVLRLSRRRLGG